MQHLVIIPGLSDKRNGLIFTTKNWPKKYGIVPHVISFGWQSESNYKNLFDLMEKEIDSLYKKFGLISILGTSAGASAAINLYIKNKNKVKKVVCVCGRLSDPDVKQRTYYPKDKIGIFKDSIRVCEKNQNELTKEDKQKILSIIPIYDDVVPIRTMRFTGIKTKRIFAVQHILSMSVAMIFYSKSITDFLKS